MKSLTALLVASALALTSCRDTPVLNRVEVPADATDKTSIVFKSEYFEYTGGRSVPDFVYGYDTDGDYRTIEEALIVRGHYGRVPLPALLAKKPRSEWRHVLAPGATAKRFVTDNTYVMTPRQQIVFNEIAQLTAYSQ